MNPVDPRPDRQRLHVDRADPLATELHVKKEVERRRERPLGGVSAVRLLVAERLLSVHVPDERGRRPLQSIDVELALPNPRLSALLRRAAASLRERPPRMRGLVDERIAVQSLNNVDLPRPRPAAARGILVLRQHPERRPRPGRILELRPDLDQPVRHHRALRTHLVPDASRQVRARIGVRVGVLLPDQHQTPVPHLNEVWPRRHVTVPVALPRADPLPDIRIQGTVEVVGEDQPVLPREAAAIQVDVIRENEVDAVRKKLRALLGIVGLEVVDREAVPARALEVRRRAGTKELEAVAAVGDGRVDVGVDPLRRPARRVAARA